MYSYKIQSDSCRSQFFSFVDLLSYKNTWKLKPGQGKLFALFLFLYLFVRFYYINAFVDLADGFIQINLHCIQERHVINE